MVLAAAIARQLAARGVFVTPTQALMLAARLQIRQRLR